MRKFRIIAGGLLLAGYGGALALALMTTAALQERVDALEHDPYRQWGIARMEKAQGAAKNVVSDKCVAIQTWSGGCGGDGSGCSTSPVNVMYNCLAIP